MMFLSSRVRAWSGTAIALAALVCLAAGASAQTETGRVVGTVADQQGGVLPGTSVTLTATGSGVQRNAFTDNRGAFVFSNVMPGDYEVMVELAGFTPKRIKTTVQVGATVTVPVVLQVGGQVESVQVTAETPLVNVATSEVAAVVNQTQIRELPTITRNVYDLVSVAGNVSPDDANTGRGAGFNINGLRVASTNILLDGAANNDEFRSSIGQEVPLDSVQEFSVVTNNFSAQYGRATGGIVNVVTKSGTNSLSGTGYWFFRNEKLATNNYDNKVRDIPKDPFKRNQSGFSVGGPVKKDKVHFFGSLESIRVRSEATDIAWVPTSQLIALTSPVTQAYFNDYKLAASINGPIILAGQVPGLVAGGPFSQIPADTPAFGQVIQKFPSDAGAGDPRNEWQLVGRLDYAINNASTFYARYAFQWADRLQGVVSNSPWEGFNTGQRDENHSMLGSYTRVWSNAFTSQTKFVFNRLFNEQPLNGNPTPTLYLGSITTRTSINGIKVALPGYLPYNPGSGIPFGGPQKLWQLYQDQTWIKGSHELRFGGSYVYIMDDRTFGAYANPVQGLGTSLGRGLDNLILGQLQSFQTAVDPQGKYPGEVITLPVSQPVFTRNNRYNEWAAYFNDSWRLRDRITLSLGMRYEYYGVQHNTDPTLDSNYYFGTGNEFERIRTGSIQLAPDSSVGGLWAADKNNFAPRLGVAWDVFGDGRTSVRGGYGMAYERNFGNVTFNVIQNPPNYATVSLTAPEDVPSLPIFRTVEGPLGGTGSKVLPNTSTRNVDPNIVNAYAHFWSAAFQHELWPRIVASVEYVGSAGESLYGISNINRAGSGVVYLGDEGTTSRLRQTQYTNMNTRGNGGTSRYHGIVTTLSMSRLGDWGVDLNGRYTYGRAKDNLSSTFSESYNNFNLGFLDPFDPQLDYGWADFDVRHRVSIAGIYELPFFKKSEGLGRTLLGGWQVAGIITAQTGAPFTIFDCSNAITACARLREMGAIGSYTMTATGNPNEFVYLDLANQVPGIGTIFNEITGTNEMPPAAGYPSDMTARNTFRRPGRWNVDASFGKRFRFADHLALNVRLEVYNLFNHANLYVADADADISSFTQIYAVKGYTSSYGIVGDGQRRMQIGVKFEF